MSNYNVSLFLSSVLLALSFSVFSSPFVYWFLSASSDEGRWVQMKGILPSHSSAALLVIWILLRHSAPQICHSTLQWMALCYVSGCRRVCVCVCVCVHRGPVRTEAGAFYYLMSFLLQWKSPWTSVRPIHTHVENKQNAWYARRIKRPSWNTQLSAPFLSRMEPPLLSCPTYKPPTPEWVCVWEALSRQNATEAYFRGWLYEGAGLSHAPAFSAPVNLAHFTQCRGGFPAYAVHRNRHS